MIRRAAHIAQIRQLERRHLLRGPANAGILVASLVALVLYAGSRRSRYFGNTAPLLMVLALLFVYTTQVVTAPWLWALPFLFTFVGGVFADELETRLRAPWRSPKLKTPQWKLFLLLTAGIILTQAALCWSSMAGVLG